MTLVSLANRFFFNLKKVLRTILKSVLQGASGAAQAISSIEKWGFC